MRGTVLLVDDQPLPRQALANELTDAGFRVIQASDGEEAWLRFAESPPDVVITDMVMPRADGLELLSRIRERSEVPVILFTARGSIQNATAAIKSGAQDFVASPDVELEDLVRLVSDAAARSRPSAEHPELEQRLVGRSRSLQKVRERLSGLAPLRTPVLVCGEPGTGRATAIRALHELGATAGGNLVRLSPDTPRLDTRLPAPSAVHLAGIDDFAEAAQREWSERLLAAEREGWKRGPRILASAADTPGVLAKDHHFERGPGRALLRFAVELPPLRTVRDDIPAIARHLIERIGARLGRRIGISPAALELLGEQRWRGNAAELGRLLERAITFSRGRQIRRELVADLLRELEEDVGTLRAQRAVRERDQLIQALRDTGGNISRSAEILQRSRSAVYRLIEKYEIPLKRED